MRIRRPQSVKGETTRKTGNGPEKTFESLRHVMRDDSEVFRLGVIYLNQIINEMPIKIVELQELEGTGV